MALLLGVASGCASSPFLARTNAALEAQSEPWVARHRETFSQVLEHALEVDAFVCEPEPERVFFGSESPGLRLIRGSMPHYDVYFGPMQYWLRRQAGGWRVEVLIAIETPEYQGVLELPDCALEHELEGPVSCTGKAFSSVETLEVCPEIGHFSAPLTEHNLGALLRQWSERVEEYYNRDARAARLPVTYDFEFVPVRVGEVPATASLVVPLAPSCGRTPYFHAMRSGWSLPIVAHEMGHVLGLLDEYEMFSGIFDFYPKTPFEGAERSRMGLSMREDTRFLPLHHYLILRRYFCPEPGRTEYAAEF